MKKPNIILLLTAIAMLCTAPLFAQFQWFANMIGPNPSTHCGPLGIRVGFSNNQNCTFLMPAITIQFRATPSGAWGSIATMVPTSPGATGDYYDFSMVANQSGYYRALISTASGYTPCSGQTVASNTSNTVQHIVNPVPLADFNINGSASGIVQTYKCAPIVLNYTGTGTVTQYRYKIEECTSLGVVVAGGYNSNSTYAWVSGAAPASTNLNTGAVATRFNSFPGYYLVTLQVSTATCSSVEKKVRIYVNSAAPAATAAFRINNTTPPVACTAPMDLFGCPGYPIALTNFSTNATLYKIELYFGGSSCVFGNTPVYSSGFITTFPSDLKNLPGPDGDYILTHPGFYNVVLTVQNACGVSATPQVGYINVAGAPSGLNANFTTKVKVKPGATFTIGSCTMSANTEFSYSDNPPTCGGSPGYNFVMEHTSFSTPNPAGRTSTEFQLEGLAGTGSNNYDVRVVTYKYVNGSGWVNMNYLSQPEVFPNATSLRLTDLLWDNPANPYYMHFDSDATATALSIYKVAITITNECDSRSNSQVIQLFPSALRSGKSGGFEAEAQAGADIEAPLVFPNPSRNEVSFVIKAHEGNTLSVGIYDLKGALIKMVAQGQPAIEGTNNFKADIRQLPAGMYFYKIHAGDAIYNGKWIKE